MVADRRKYGRFAINARYQNGEGQLQNGLISLSYKGFSVFLDEKTVKSTPIGMPLDYAIEINGFLWVLPVKIVRKIDQNRLAMEIQMDKFTQRDDWKAFLQHFGWYQVVEE